MKPGKTEVSLEEEVLKFLDKWDDLPDNQTSRWIVCESLEERKIIDKEGLYAILPTDCGCCLAGDESEKFRLEVAEGNSKLLCGCICHKRIPKLVAFIQALLDKQREGLSKDINEAFILGRLDQSKVNQRNDALERFYKLKSKYSKTS